MELKAERTYNFLIVEDEMLLANHIKQCLEAENFRCSGIAKSYNEAVVFLKKLKNLNFIILDVNLMGSKTGIDLANEINAHFHVPFFFLTSYSDRETLSELRKTDPLGYLSKPINEIELLTALQIAANKLAKNLFAFEVGNTHYHIDLNQLLYIQADHVYIEVTTTSECLLLRTSLGNIEKILPEGSVARISRSILVNPAYVQKYNGATLHIAEMVFSVSKKYRGNLA